MTWSLAGAHRSGEGRALFATLSQRERKISAEEAARIIFGTPDPDAVQVGEVRALILRGVLPGSRDGRTTTTTAVAEYLAAVSLRRQVRPRGGAPADDTVPERSPVGNRELRDAYRGLLKDYFLALIHRRDRRRYSRFFQRAVIAGQVISLVLILGAVTALWLGLRPAAEPPELAAVKTWIGQNSKRYRIERWFPPQRNAKEGGTSIRVIYTYSDTGRNTIRTDRLFVIREGKVASVNSVD